jgi:hypothetical protein
MIRQINKRKQRHAEQKHSIHQNKKSNDYFNIPVIGKALLKHEERLRPGVKVKKSFQSGGWLLAFGLWRCISSESV